MHSFATSESSTPAPRDKTRAGVPRLSRTAYRPSFQKDHRSSLPACSSSPPIVPESAIQFLIGRLGLTQRQAEILHWIAEGKTNEEIALILGRSFHTVKNHVSQILLRLEVDTRTAAAACAYRAHISKATATQRASA